MKNNNNNGVTMVELLVAAALGAMIMGSAMSIWSYASRNISRTTTKQILQMDAQRVLTQLKADLKAAKSETFKAIPEPLTLEFKRYVVSETDNEKLSAEKTEDVRYVLNKPILIRTVAGKGNKTLSNNVENLRITRKILSDAQKDSQAYLESRVDIALDLLSIAQGTTIEERHTQHTSVVIRDEFYTMVNKEREEVLEIADEVAKEIGEVADSSFFNDTLNAETLMNLSNTQLDDIDKVQEDSVKQAQDNLDELNKKILNVDTGKKWWQVSFIGFLANEEGADVKALRNKLEAIKLADNAKLEPAASKNRPSDQVDKVIEELNVKIGTKDVEFLVKSYDGHTVFNEKSVDPEEQKKSVAQKRAYDMRVLDRQVEKALAALTESERAEAKAAGTIPKKMIEQVDRTREEIREELASTGMIPNETELEKKVFEARVEKEYNEILFLKEQYNNCKLDWMDNGGADENELKAYEAAKQLKTLAESKRETLKTKEIALDNREEIIKAKAMKKVDFGGQ